MKKLADLRFLICRKLKLRFLCFVQVVFYSMGSIILQRLPIVLRIKTKILILTMAFRTAVVFLGPFL